MVTKKKSVKKTSKKGKSVYRKEIRDKKKYEKHVILYER